MLEPRPRTASEAAFERALQLFPGGVNSGRREFEPPLVFVKAAGARITDVDGNTYADFQLGFGSIVLGHNYPAVTHRVQQVMAEIDLICAGTTTIEIELAEQLVAVVPSFERLHFCNSGSEAVNHAIRLARGVTGRSKILMFRGGYHGWSLPSNLDRPGRDEVAEPAYRIDDDVVAVDYNDLAGVEDAFAACGEEIAAIIVEPVAHNLGAVMPVPQFLAGLRQLSSDWGSLLIFDEVITGFRHALGGYQSICGVLPDLTVFAKCLANGFPIACIGGTSRLMERFSTGGGPVGFGGTFNASPISVAAGLATIGILRESGTYEHLYRLGEMVRSGLAEITRRKGLPCQPAGFGSVHILYFFEGTPRNHRDVWRNDDQRDLRFRRAMIEYGFFMLPQPHRRSYLCLQHTEADVQRFLEAAEQALAAAFA